MTLPTQLTKVVYAPDGVRTEYLIPFPYYDKGVECILVVAAGTEEYLHNFTLAASPSRVVFVAAPPAGTALVIRRATRRAQLTDYPVTGRFPAKVVEVDFDRLTAMIQEIDEVLSRAVLVDASQDEAPTAQQILDLVYEQAVRAERAADKAENAADKAENAARDAGNAAENAADKVKALLKQYAERAEAAAAETFLESGVYNVRRMFAVAEDIPEGGTLTLPVPYYPTRAVLWLSYKGVPCTPIDADVDDTGMFQYAEVGTDPNVLSNRITVHFPLRAGDKIDLWIVTSALGKNLDAQAAYVAECRAEVVIAQQTAAAAAASAAAAAASLDRMEQLVGVGSILSGAFNNRWAWLTAAAVAEGGILTLPGNYLPGRDTLLLMSGGVVITPKKPGVEASGKYHYEEVGTLDALSNKVKLTFAAPAGSKFDMWVVALAAVQLAEAQASADAAGASATQAGQSATSAGQSATTASGAATTAGQAAASAQADAADAHASMVASAASASAAAGSESVAAEKAQRAEDFADNAYIYQNNAYASAEGASESAAEAGAGAGNAAASEAASSASENAAGQSEENAAASEAAALEALEEIQALFEDADTAYIRRDAIPEGAEDTPTEGKRTLMQALTIDTLTPTSAILSGWSVDVEAGGGADIETQVVIAAATDTLAGLMPAADHVQIAQLSADVLALQQQGGKYIGRSFPTAAALAAYVFAATDNPGDFTYVSDDEAHAGATTRYVIGGAKDPDTRAWEFAYILERDPIGTATTAALGLVKGSNTSGQVYVETNGTMSLVGYDALKSAINAQVPVVTATNTALGIVKGSTAYGEISISAAGVMTAVGLRKRLTAATTFSIRTSADGGNDTNDGRSAAGAMLTFNNLVTRLVQEYDLNRQTVTINIGAGTWTNQAWRLDTDKLTNPGTIVIQGAGVDATILSASNGTTTSRNGLLIYGPPSAYQIQVKDMQFTNCGSCLGFYYGAYGRLGNLKFGPHFANKSGYDVISDLGSWVTTLGASGSLINLTHTSGAGNAASYPYYAGDRATMRLDYCNVAIAPDMTTTGFVNIMNGEFEIYAAARTVFSGTLTGKRANITRKGKLYTALRGEAALPGTVASTVDYTGCVIDSPRPARKYQKLTAALAANATWATPAYIVGSGALQIYLGGVIAPAGTSASNGFYQEVGNAGASSTSIKIFEALPIGASLTAVVAA